VNSKGDMKSVLEDGYRRVSGPLVNYELYLLRFGHICLSRCSLEGVQLGLSKNQNKA